MPQLFYLPKQVPLSSAGTLLSGAKLTFTLTGTTTPQDTYSDFALTTPNANPVVADGNGVFPPIYLINTPRYRVKLTTSADVLIYQQDDVGPDTAASLGAATLTASNVFTGTSTKLSAAEVRLLLDETDAGTDKRLWDFDIQGAVMKLRTRTDADGSGKDVLTFTRGTTTVLASGALGNATDLAPFTQYGKQTFSSAAAITTSEQIPVVKVKAALTARTSTIIPINDPDLAYAIPATGTYLIEVFVILWGTTTGTQGMNSNVNYSGTIGSGSRILTGAASINGTNLNFSTAAFSATTSAVAFIRTDISTTSFTDIDSFKGVLIASTTGTVGFSWSQEASSANATNVGAGSYMKITKLS